MYTRCPSCRAEISFEPPANMETLPDGYKHRIKCPSCGVTIGVKINKIDAAPATLVQQSSAYNQQTSFEPVYAEDTAQAPSKKAAKQDKRSGVGRNITVMIMSLLFIAASVVGFLINSGTIKNPLLGFGVFDGISSWMLIVTNFAALKEAFATSIAAGISLILPAALFTLACINFLVAFISACGKKFGRAWNLISSILIAGVAIFAMFVNLIGYEGGIAQYFKALFDGGLYAYVIVAALGLIQLILGLCFTKSLKKKHN